MRALLMGGQACILYGAAEFSRDIDLAVLADENNLSRLQALRELRTSEILIDLCRNHARTARAFVKVRPAIGPALRGDRGGVERALQAEQDRCRALDRRYWAPLRAELADWRRALRE